MWHLHIFRRNHAMDTSYLDIIGCLPPELAIAILRNLDPESLISTCLVCKRWLNLVRSDSILRSRVGHQLRRKRSTDSHISRIKRRLRRVHPFEESNRSLGMLSRELYGEHPF